MLITLEKNGIVPPTSFMHVMDGFKPKHPLQRCSRRDVGPGDRRSGRRGLIRACPADRKFKPPVQAGLSCLDRDDPDFCQVEMSCLDIHPSVACRFGGGWALSSKSVGQVPDSAESGT
jgi:hypothetical protein